MKKSYYLIFLFLFGSFLLIPSCLLREVKGKEESDFSILRKRIDEYWGYIINGDIEKAYNMEHPQYQNKFSISKYIYRFKLVKYEGFEIMDLKILNGDAQVEIEVNLKYSVKHFQNKIFKKNIIERWKKHNNIWYHLPEGFEIKN